jgi:hypothetical protein
MFNRIVYKIVFSTFVGLFASVAFAFPSSGALEKCFNSTRPDINNNFCNPQGSCVWSYCAGSDSLAYAWFGGTNSGPDIMVGQYVGECPSGYFYAGALGDQCDLPSNLDTPADPTVPPIDPDSDPNLGPPPYCPI